MLTLKSTRRRPGFARRARFGLALAAGLAALGCANGPGVLSSVDAAPAERDPYLSEAGKTALQNLYLFACAPDYLVYPEQGVGPAAEKLACLEEVERRYLDLESVRTYSSKGSEYSLSEPERVGMVLYGADYLEDWVRKLLERESSGRDEVADAS